MNIYDLGRYVQQSYYSGPEPFIPPGGLLTSTFLELVVVPALYARGDTGRAGGSV